MRFAVLRVDWWTRQRILSRPQLPHQGAPEAIAPFINHYTKPGDVVVDPFCGSGMTGVAAAFRPQGDPERSFARRDPSCVEPHATLQSGRAGRRIRGDRGQTR